MNIPTAIALTLFLACLVALLAVGMARQGARCWRSFAGRRGAFAAVAILCAVCMIHAQKRGTISFDGDFIRDAGSYATNDVLHVAATNAPQAAMIDLTSAPLLVYRRPCDSTNAADWVELMPRRTFGELPADWTSVNATNYNYLVYLDYVPPSPVHTNGVWQLRGFEVPGMANAYAFPNTRQMTQLPHNAVRVEYLESTGTQWIDTATIPSSGWEVEIDFSSTRWQTGELSLFGQRTSYTSQDAFSAFTSGLGMFPQYDGNQGRVDNTANVLGRRYNFRHSEKGAFLDGVQIKPENGASFTCEYSMYLFAKNQAGSWTDRPFHGRIYFVKFWDANDELVRDFIPVRVGRVGYMYDRVSGRLFGNSGTGAFIIGPDVGE